MELGAYNWLRLLFLDWTNNFISVSAFANEHGLTESDAKILINMGRRYHEESVLLKEDE
jgi:hypothetical protein|tara:strand:+ start:162 stop:338 length:177 start_codon:yes stop_codon:yes gene_type:complete